MARDLVWFGLLPLLGLLGDAPAGKLIEKPGLFEPLTEPPCSYCSTQDRKGLVDRRDPVIAWIRASHNGGAIPIRHFLSAPRVINDTYGLFFYDPNGGYVAAYRKDYGFKFHGWRGGVMVAQGPDGSLYSALTGLAFQGPKKGQRLERVPSLTTEWGYWLMLHPESTAYDLFDGKRYASAPLPAGMSAEARASMGRWTRGSARRISSWASRQTERQWPSPSIPPWSARRSGTAWAASVSPSSGTG